MPDIPTPMTAAQMDAARKMLAALRTCKATTARVGNLARRLDAIWIEADAAIAAAEAAGIKE